jgi:hypothetical protein
MVEQTGSSDLVPETGIRARKFVGRDGTLRVIWSVERGDAELPRLGDDGLYAAHEVGRVALYPSPAAGALRTADPVSVPVVLMDPQFRCGESSA